MAREQKFWQGMEPNFAGALRLGRRPVAVTFLDREPDGIERFKGTEPSSCAFWRLAAEGRVFYTVSSDHFNCAVGSYTQNIALSPEREKETEQTLAMMFWRGIHPARRRRTRYSRAWRRRLPLSRLRHWEPRPSSPAWCFSLAALRPRCY